MRRTSILLEESAYELLALRAKRNGTTVTAEIREAVDRVIQDEPNPNQWLLDLADEMADIEWQPGPAVDSDEFKDASARAVYRDAMNREPDW